MARRPYQQTNHLSTDEMEEIAENAALKALATFFIMLDVKVDDHEQVKALREDLAWSREARIGSEKAKKWIVATVLTGVTSVLALLGWQAWEIFRQGWNVFVGR